MMILYQRVFSELRSISFSSLGRLRSWLCLQKDYVFHGHMSLKVGPLSGRCNLWEIMNKLVATGYCNWLISVMNEFLRRAMLSHT